MSEVDEAIARARNSWARIAGESGDVPLRTGRRTARRTQAIGKRIARIAIADAAILIAAVVIGLFVPLGIFGAMLFMLMLLVATIGFAIWPLERPPSTEKLAETDIHLLPSQTERWLTAQRPALPAPAITMVDRIGLRLDTLALQLASVPADSPEAADIRKLVGEQLPAFVTDYSRVPASLRTTPRNGRTPDAELVDGLKLIEQEIGELTARLAQDDLDNLSTRGRFLETKYRG